MLMWWPSVISVITLHVDMVAVRNLRRTDDRTNGVRQQLVESGGHPLV